jgi:hypothetical protein
MMENLFLELHKRQIAQDADATPTSSTRTDGLVGELLWKNSLQQRTTAVVTISFNILAALLVIASILFDARKALRRGSATRASYGATASHEAPLNPSGTNLPLYQMSTQLRYFH